MSFGDWLLGQLRDRRWTQREFAERVGVSRAAVRPWLFGEYRPSPENCWRIADALGVPRDDVLTLAGYEATTTLTDLATVDYRGAIRAQFPDPIAMRILAHIRAVLEVEAALVGDHEKEVEEWKRTGYDIFGALGRVPGQSVNESAVIEAIRKLLQEYDSQRDSDAE